jgi:hypothetical protein
VPLFYYVGRSANLKTLLEALESIHVCPSHPDPIQGLKGFFSQEPFRIINGLGPGCRIPLEDVENTAGRKKGSKQWQSWHNSQENHNADTGRN